eukprot:14812161-Alexandrium_andersonii.AAC.1
MLGTPFEAGAVLPTKDGTIPAPYYPTPPHGTWEVEVGPTQWRRLHSDIEAALRRRLGQMGSYSTRDDEGTLLH